jgi:serine protease Do
MKLIVKSFVGFISVMAGVLIAVAVFDHLNITWGKEPTPSFIVDSTPINRDSKQGNSYAPVVKKAAPSVVNIYTTRIVKITRNPMLSDPFFRQFFGGGAEDQDQGERTHKELSLGSGVIVSPDGYILTANHVVAGADEIKIRIAYQKREFNARIVGRDEATDVAVVKIDEASLPAITLADSDQLQVGDVVLAIGNPLNVGQTVTMGIVSALGRAIGLSRNGYEDFIQTDAAINPGNSGGALVDAEGRLVGINTAIKSETGGYQGIGFAVPINMARDVMQKLILNGKISRGYLGISMQDVTSAMADQFNLPDQKGVFVDDVMPGTAAAKANIQQDDVIVALNGKDVVDRNSLRLAVSEFSPGTSVTVKIIRNGRTKDVSLILGEMPGFLKGNGSDENNSDTETSKTDALDGVTVADLDQDIRRELKVPDRVQGAIVAEVDEDSNPAQAGLRQNDIITEINRHPVTNSDDAVKYCKDAKGDQILVKIWRRDRSGGVFTQYLTVDNTRTESNKK